MRLQHPAIRPGDEEFASRLHDELDSFESRVEPLPGLAADQSREAFVAHLVESDRRSRYIAHLRQSTLSDRVLDPGSRAFNPLMGAIVLERNGRHDDACWMIFLYTQFGRNRRNGWALAARFYGRLGQGGVWDWTRVRSDVDVVRTWLDANIDALRAPGAGFGNHRKYESLSGHSGFGTGETIRAYVTWVGESHLRKFLSFSDAETDAGDRFHEMYRSLSTVTRFGRTARFDYLTTLGKLGLADVEPDRAYLTSSTGPAKGARLIYEGFPSGGMRASELEQRLRALRQSLGVDYYVLEDALCNWQKHPNQFVPFRG